MGDVVAKYRVMPESPEINLEDIKSKITGLLPENAKRHAIEEKPIAFGLKALEVTIVVPDKTGDTGAFEEAMEKIEGVMSVETVEIGLV